MLFRYLKSRFIVVSKCRKMGKNAWVDRMKIEDALSCGCGVNGGPKDHIPLLVASPLTFSLF